MEVRTVSVPFASVHGFGPNTQHVRVFFSQPVNSAVVALSGYSARYSSGDHELRQLTVTAECQTGGPVQEPDFGRVWYVDVIAKLGLRDASGNWDDPYEGEVSCTLFAQLGRVLPEIEGTGPDLSVVEG